MKLLLITEALFITCLLPNCVLSDEDFADPPPAPERPCKTIIGDFTKRQMSGLAVCTKSLKFKNGKEKAKSLNCIMVCAMKREGLIGEDGGITTKRVEFILKREFPPSLMEKAKDTFAPCIDIALKTVPEPSREVDPYCSSYDPPIKCLIAALPNLCK